MKHKNLVHLPSALLDVLRETARRSGVPLDDVLTAAVWVFSRQKAAVRSLIVSDDLFKGFTVPPARKRRKILKERIHALGSYCYAKVRRWLAR